MLKCCQKYFERKGMEVKEFFDSLSDSSKTISEILSNIPRECVSEKILLAYEKGELLIPQWENGKLVRTWINVVAHMATAALLGYHLASSLAKELAKDGYSEKDVVEALLVHDWHKRKEQAAKDHAKQSGINVFSAGQKSEITGANLLKKFGFDQKTIKLSKATGDFGLDKILKNSASFAEKLVFYCDLCTSNTTVVTWEQRLDDAAIHMQPGGRYYHTNKEFLKKYGHSHRKMYERIAKEVEQEIANHLNFQGDSNQIPLVFSQKP